MHEDTMRFLNTLLSRCPRTPDLCLTLTALHPDGLHPTPSRHIPLNQPHVLQDALDRLAIVNACGWGAFFGVGLRKTGLSRYRRGGLSDVDLLPALFVDIDDSTEAVLHQLEQWQPQPSCIVSSGGGFHAYWWLEQPTDDLTAARQILRGLARSLNGDPLSPAQSLCMLCGITHERGMVTQTEERRGIENEHQLESLPPGCPTRAGTDVANNTSPPGSVRKHPGCLQSWPGGLL